MRLVERHNFTKNTSNIDNWCFKAKNLYNRANYLIRQKFIETSKEKENGLRKYAIWMRYYDLYNLLKKEERNG